MSAFYIYGVALTIVSVFGLLAQETLKNDVQKPISDWLNKGVKADPRAWIRGVNQAFLSLFERVYGDIPPGAWSGVLWVILILAPVLLALLRGLTLLISALEADTAQLLLLSLIMASLLAAFFMGLLILGSIDERVRPPDGEEQQGGE